MRRASIRGIGLLDLRPGQLDEPVEERQGPLDVPLAGAVRVVQQRLDLGRVEAAAGGQLDEPEPIPAFHDDVQPTVVEALQHFGHRRKRSHLAQAVVVGVHEPELALLLQALADQLLVPVLEDVERDLLGRKQDDSEREEPDFGHARRLLTSCAVADPLALDPRRANP